jgi:MFS transporter, UMF1 family
MKTWQMALLHRKYLPRYGWYLYDFANSILIINGGLYFPQWIVKSNGVSDFTYNLTFALSSLLLIVLAPLLGSLADNANSPLRYLIVSNAFLIAAGIGVGLTPGIENEHTRILLALCSFFAVLVSYQLSLVFYNTLLGKVSTPVDFEQVSGRALAWGWAGGIVGIFLGLLFSDKVASIGGMAAILPCAIVAGILSSISLYLISKPAGFASQLTPTSTHQTSGGLLSDIAGLRYNGAIWVFLLAFFLFSDAILTIQNNSTIYMQVVLGLTDYEKAFQFLLILITSAIGALVSAPLVRVLGLKRGLIFALFGCTVVVEITPLFVVPIQFSIVFGVLGLLNGVVWNISRVLFFRLIPITRRNTYFGFYSTFERFASIIGPVVWSIPVSLVQQDILRYQLAWMVMGIFFLLSLVLLVRLRIS